MLWILSWLLGNILTGWKVHVSRITKLEKSNKNNTLPPIPHPALSTFKSFVPTQLRRRFIWMDQFQNQFFTQNLGVHCNLTCKSILRLLTHPAAWLASPRVRKFQDRHHLHLKHLLVFRRVRWGHHMLDIMSSLRTYKETILSKGSGIWSKSSDF